MANPYLQSQADNISTNLTKNWQTNVMPSINHGATFAGGYGGSRQGIAQGLGTQGLNQAIGQAQTGLYSNAYNTDQNLQAQKDMQASSLSQQQRLAEMNDATNRLGMQNSFDLGLGGLGANFYSTMRGQDLSAMGLGSNMMTGANAGLQGLGTQLWDTGQREQNAPTNALGQYASLLSPFTGLNQTNTQSTPGASTVGSALGGALTAAQIMKLINGG